MRLNKIKADPITTVSISNISRVQVVSYDILILLSFYSGFDLFVCGTSSFAECSAGSDYRSQSLV